MIVVSATLASAVVLVAWPPWSWVRARVDGVDRPRPDDRSVVAALVLVLVMSLVLLPPAPTIVGWAGLGVAATAWHRMRRAGDRRCRTRVRDEAHAAVDALVTELRSGAPPTTAVRRLALEAPLLAPAAAAAATGGEVASSLVAIGRRTGAHPIAEVGRAWAVSESCGAPLVTVLEQVRESARSERELHRELMSGVAPARATATLMAAMPPLGLALGAGLGVDPLAIVLTTVPGALCLAAGVGFAIAGVLWIDLIADRVETGA